MEGGAGGALVMTAAMALFLVGSLSPSSALAPYPPHAGAAPTSWTNGQVLCDFGATIPSVGVSALGRTGAGMSLGSMSVSERNPSGAVVAAAEIDGASWNVSNRSTDDAYDLAYTMEAPLTATGSAGPAVGTTDLEVDFLLPAYDGSTDGPMNVVNVSFSIANWSWQSAADHLVLAFNASASSPASEHLNTTAAPGWLMATTANRTGAEMERLGVNSSASAANVSSSPVQISANASVAFVSSSLAQVVIAFGHQMSSYRALDFSARVGVQFPSSVAGIPIADLVAAGVAGTLVSVGIAATARQLRRRPSRLIYAEE